MPTTRSLRASLPAMLLLFAVAVLAVRLPANATQRASAYTFFDPIVDIARFIEDRYYTDVDLEAMQEGAIRGMIESLDDPYTEFIPTRAVAEFEKQVRGDFVGIGAEVRLSPEGFLLIVSPLDGSPAIEAGLHAQDIIVAVDGTPTYQLGTARVISMLTGKAGTQVRLTVQRDAQVPRPVNALEPTVPGEVTFNPTVVDPFATESDPSRLPDSDIEVPGPGVDEQRFDVLVTRGRVETQTVKGLHRNGDEWRHFVHPTQRIAYLRLTQFTSETQRETPRILFDLIEQGMRGLVLDLRFNGGGSLPAAVAIADLFLKEGTIVSVQGASVPESVYSASTNLDLPDELEVVVLVNENSASASEILTGALKDNGRAIVVGERTFGKGLVQQVISLPSGAGQLKITEANYYLPSGQNIQRKDDNPVWGVDPSPGFYLPLDIEEETNVWRIRRENEILRPEADSDPSLWEDANRILDQLQDPQLTAAVHALESKLTTGTAYAPTDAYAQAEIQTGLLSAEEERLRALEREITRSRARIAALRSTAARTEDGKAFPTDEQLIGGEVVLIGTSGEELLRMTITGPGLDTWLRDAPVQAAVDPDNTSTPEE